jgi:hypothetical protein
MVVLRYRSELLEEKKVGPDHQFLDVPGIVKELEEQMIHRPAVQEMI